MSKLTGLPNAPIIVRQFPGERATLDQNASRNGSILKIDGGWTWYWGFEVMNRHPLRKLEVTGSNPSQRRANSIDVYGTGVKLINLVIHDAGQGAGMWSQAVETEVYGNLIYNNGWSAPDRGHGHGIYTQNSQGTKVYRDNIIFNQFGNGFSAYGSSASDLKGFLLEGNVFFNDRFLVGGNSPAQQIALKENFFYNATAELGWGNNQNKDLTVVDNYFTAGVMFKWWKNVTVEGNTIFNTLPYPGTKALSIYLNPDGRLSDYTIEGNKYFRSNRMGQDFYVASPPKPAQSLNFAQWQEHGFDRKGTYRSWEGSFPGGVKVIVRPNEYDKERAHIIIYNWERRDSVEADLSALGLSPGTAWEIRNAQNYFEQVITGIYRGSSITIPMSGWTVAEPIGFGKPLSAPTFPEFGVFVFQKSTIKSSARLTILDAKASWLFPTSVTLLWSTNKPATCAVEYGTTTSYASNFIPPQSAKTTHAAGLRQLTPGTTYHYRIKASDSAGNVAVTEDLTFTTPAEAIQR